MNKSLLTLLAFSLFTLFASSTQAQTASRLSGTITHSGTSRPLEGVNVLITETAQGTVTNREGKYSIDQITPGWYTLIVRRIGFKPIEESLFIPADTTRLYNVALATSTIPLDEILAQADRPYSAASSSTIRGFDLRTRPTRSSQDLLQLAPGLITSQHAGGGKAEQIFLRGFDADHGTDVAISVDGVPVNMVSHGHGQGYADLHFLIPELVEDIEVYKGPYNTRFGNLATAGAITFSTKDHLEHNMIRLEGGRFNTANLTALYRIPVSESGHQGAYFGAQFQNTDGPVNSPQEFQRFNVFSKFHTHLSEETKLSFSISGFSSAWNASGQIPTRAIEQGIIDRFGSLDDLEGGTTGRQDVNLTYTAKKANEAFQIQGYATRYNFKLFSNFTFFLEDPLNGDMIEQTDDRRMVGINSSYRFTRTGGRTISTLTLGGGLRADDVVVSLWKSPNRSRQENLIDADISERNISLWAQEEWVFSTRLRLQLGLRGDYFTYNVNDRLEGVPSSLPHVSGYAQQTILSPKASLVFSPASSLDFFTNIGSGFHSNDARAVVQGQRVKDLLHVYHREQLSDTDIDNKLQEQNVESSQATTGTLPRAIGSEIGFRLRIADRMHVSAAAWLLHLENEFVYVGDGGFTERSGRSKRYGVDIETRLGITPWLSADADVNLSRGRLLDEPTGRDAIPLAPRFTSTGGLSMIHPGGFEGSLRYIHIGDRPANESGTVSAKGYTLFNLLAAYQPGAMKFSIVLENLFNIEWNEAQFDTESQLIGESAPVSELHFTPGNPRSIRIGVSYSF